MRRAAQTALQVFRDEYDSDVEEDTASEDSAGCSDLSEVSTTITRRRRAASGRSRGKQRTLHRWSEDEHKKLEKLVQTYGTDRNWSTIAGHLSGRTGKQCRERWLNHLRPGIRKGGWSNVEEFVLSLCHSLVGSHWSKMARRLQGRTENSIKNFWNATFRSKSANKKNGILWTYISTIKEYPNDPQTAFITTVQKLVQEGELPAEVESHIYTDYKVSNVLDAEQWRAVFVSEAEYLQGPAPLDGDSSPVSTPIRSPHSSLNPIKTPMLTPKSMTTTMGSSVLPALAPPTPQSLGAAKGSGTPTTPLNGEMTLSPVRIGPGLTPLKRKPITPTAAATGSPSLSHHSDTSHHPIPGNSHHVQGCSCPQCFLSTGTTDCHTPEGPKRMKVGPFAPSPLGQTDGAYSTAGGASKAMMSYNMPAPHHHHSFQSVPTWGPVPPVNYHAHQAFTGNLPAARAHAMFGAPPKRASVPSLSDLMFGLGAATDAAKSGPGGMSNFNAACASVSSAVDAMLSSSVPARADSLSEDVLDMLDYFKTDMAGLGVDSLFANRLETLSRAASLSVDGAAAHLALAHSMGSKNSEVTAELLDYFTNN